MNRPIKFRVWDKNNKRFEVEPFLGVTISLWKGELCLAEQYELQQFTGLLDKNGKEIYEGDIVRAKYGKKIIDQGEVVIDSFGVRIRGSDNYVVKLYKIVEVIGNIFMNPELLNDDSK